MASHELNVAVRQESPGAGSRAHRSVWAVLSACCVAVLLAPRLLPFSDYPEWVLQGQIVHDLWTGAVSNAVPVAQLYALLPVPVPNLAASVGIALLAFLVPTAMAGRIFLVLGVLGFGYGYGFLVRRLQRQPTVLEFTGFIWAFGYFLKLAVVSLDAPLQRVFDAIDATVPNNAAVATLAVPSEVGCRSQAGPSIAIPSLNWFNVYRMLAHGEVRADLQETSGVALRFDPASGPGLTSLSTAASEARATIDATPATYVEVFACPADLAHVTSALAPQYPQRVSGDGFAILQRSP